MAAEQFRQQALLRSQQAEQTGLLVPLATEVLPLQLDPFVIRRLLSRTPKHLKAGGPKPNPFLPWEPGLEVCRLPPEHVLLLNKYPVQRGHVLVISDRWKAQSGWLDVADWRAVVQVGMDTSGLWFFNSSAAAGASQPHRHLQLLPGRTGASICPLEPLVEAGLKTAVPGLPVPWAHALSARQDPNDPQELAHLYAEHCRRLGLGCPRSDPQPRGPYNLLFSDRWLLTLVRSREHWAGFSVNALGFAGFLLATEASDLAWLQTHGAWALLEAVAAIA